MSKKTIFILSIIFIFLFFIFLFFISINSKKVLPQNNNSNNNTTTTTTNVLSGEQQENKSTDAIPIKTTFLSTDKNIYNVNEDVKILSIVKNDLNVKKKWRVVYNFSSEDKEVALIGQEKIVMLEGGAEERINFSTKVEDTFSPGYYIVAVSVYENDFKINYKTEMIKIEGTERKITANIIICADKDCSEEKYVFTLGEPVFIKINTEIEGLEVIGKIKNNNNDLLDLNFKNYIAEVVSVAIGNYEINVALTKSDYQKKIIIKNFLIIKNLPIIENESKCLLNGRCENYETKQNCPQDCF